MSDESIARTTGTPYLDVASAHVGQIQGVADEHMPVIHKLLKIWRDKYPRNLIRTGYYDAREAFKDFRISIPDTIKTRVAPMIGWPAKAVRSLADLSVLDGLSIPGQDTHGLQDMFDANRLDVDIPQCIVSCYIHSCSFMTVSTDPENPERILFTPRSADWSAAIWNRARRRIDSALTITMNDDEGRVQGFDVWLPGCIYRCQHIGRVWQAERWDTYLDECTVVPFIYDPQINRPFGRSRINRTVMNLTDIGFRTVVRMEASAEFYSVPKLWFLGADRDAFSADTWSSLISAINAISKDEDGEKPTLQQVTQATMTPHSDMLKTVAMLAASEMSVPVDEMGITLDNPTSAEAMAAAERKLTRIADRQNRIFTRNIRDMLSLGVRLREHLTITPDDMLDVRPIWQPTREVSISSRADAFSKIASVQPAFANSEAGWRYAGFSQDDITLIMDAIRQQDARSTLDKALALGGETGDQQTAGGQSDLSSDEHNSSSETGTGPDMDGTGRVDTQPTA